MTRTENERRPVAVETHQIPDPLLDGQIVARNGASAEVSRNYTAATADMFVNAAAGDLHLVGTAGAVIDAVEMLPNAPTDRDGQPCPQGSAADYGADELPVGPEHTATSRSGSPTTGQKTGGSATPTAHETITLASTAEVSVGGLPTPWLTLDVGNPQRAGSATYASGIFTVQGGGTDIGGHADQFRFVYQTLAGDGEIVARVTSLERTHVWAKAGVMIRDELTAGARHASALITAEKGVAFQRRLVQGGSAAQTIAGTGKTPYWLKITRRGSTFTAYGSMDGTLWNQLGTDTVAMNHLAYVGLAVTSRSSRSVTSGSFTGVTVAAGATSPNEFPVVTITSPASGSVHGAGSAIAVAAHASDPDGAVRQVDFFAGPTLIGSSTGIPYSATWSNPPAGVHTLTAMARDDSGASTTSGGVDVTVLVNHPPTVSLTSPDHNTSFTEPATIPMTASAADADGTIAKVEFYAGSTLVGSDATSPYSVTWSGAPAGTYTLSAKAWDSAGAYLISRGVNVTVAPATNRAPRFVVFTASTDHATSVTSYAIEVFVSGADPATTSPYRRVRMLENQHRSTARSRWM